MRLDFTQKMLLDSLYTSWAALEAGAAVTTLVHVPRALVEESEGDYLAAKMCGWSEGKRGGWGYWQKQKENLNGKHSINPFIFLSRLALP